MRNTREGKDKDSDSVGFVVELGLCFGPENPLRTGELRSITVQVESSHLVDRCDSEGHLTACGFAQQITAMVDGKKLILEENGFRKSLLSPGEYHARMADVQPAGKYKSECSIELQLTDGKTRWYLVVGESQ